MNAVTREEMEYKPVKKPDTPDTWVAESARRATSQSWSVTSAAKRWMPYAGIVATGISNSSQTIDDVVYRSKD
jgi:hypothetical protein